MARTNSRRMHAAREQFFQKGKELDAKGDPAANCWLCKERIDYSAEPHSTPESHNLDHYHPVATHPELQEDPDNFRHSHRLCNGQRSSDAPSPGLGEPVANWW